MSSALRHLLRHGSTVDETLIPAKRVSLVAMKIRYLIETMVCVEIQVQGFCFSSLRGSPVL